MAKEVKRAKRAQRFDEEQAAREEKERLSEFAYRPTSSAGLNEEKPFGNKAYKHMKGLLMQRVSPSRYLHSVSVAKTARKLARAYGYDADVARMAGLLHDWDKALSPVHLALRVEDFGLRVDDEALARMPWTLHGPTAAAALERDFPMFGEEVFRAIERHTVAAPAMSALDMIVFVADKIEPTHDVAEYRRLYKKIGQIPLEEMFREVLKLGLAYLVSAGKPISHETVVVWNWYSGAR